MTASWSGNLIPKGDHLGISWIGSCAVSTLTGTESLGLGASMLHKFPAVVVYATRAEPVYSIET